MEEQKPEPEIKIFRKYHPRVFMFTIFAVVFTLDFITTALALNLPRFEGQFIEYNPLVAWFQSFGVIGYMGAFIFSMVMIYLISYFSYKWLWKIKNLDTRMNAYFGVMFLYVLIEGNAVFNNIGLMLGIGI